MNATTNPIDRLYAALAAGEVDAARDCLADDALVWHCFEAEPQSVSGVVREWHGFVSHFVERTITNVRRQATAEGFVQQHVMKVRTTDGRQLSWPTCIVVKIRDGRIARLDEYLDRKGSDAGTPG
jgi:ketosteroid isomerase-like protein